MRLLAVALDTGFEQGGAVVGAVELIGDGLMVNAATALVVGSAIIAAVDGDGFAFH